VALAMLEWVDWFNNRRLLEPIGAFVEIGLFLMADEGLSLVSAADRREEKGHQHIASGLEVRKEVSIPPIFNSRR
jgi:hypothetical protein